ncbi:Ribbon-helix-helix protein, copG family [Xenococcus sp. PCC 7305]|uniref:hypothetical protein n=1 Tax=Xenococcus sp. PCC 7305 TaxID=102125 RepID=UPI0002AC04B6|nr:hypothetical protein [Xenococcus sp. PCC 7305]ELS04821.1 Ribbon-helix-helix protein, copG family [Xenococcus sp. PCC 7305]
MCHLPPELYDPLPPSIEDLLIYEEELSSECPYITYEWATHEIKNHMINWVRVGLVAEKVRYYKLWQGKFASWQEYCQQALGKAKWQIHKTIEAARVTLYLARAGFETLPNCEAQASKLAKTAPEDQDLIISWRKVLDAVPKHLISANAIGRTFGEEPKKQRLNVPTELYEKLERKARDRGISVNELLGQLLDDEETEAPASNSEFSKEESPEDYNSVPVTQKMMTRWETDLEEIVKSYDFQNWLTLVWFKFLVPV